MMPHRSFLTRIPALLPVLFAILLIISAAAAQDLPVTGTELLQNGAFSEALTWQLYKESGGNAQLSAPDGEMLIDVSGIGRVAHAVQPYYDGFRLFRGTGYILSFDARSTFPRDIFVRIQLNGGDYHAYFEENVSLTEETRHFSFPFVMKEPGDPAPRLCVNMGFTDSMSAAGLTPDDIPPHQVYFDNFSLTVGDVSGTVTEEAAVKVSPIRVNQAGYLPDAPKTAVFADLEAETFRVVKSATGGVVFEGTLSAPAGNPWSGETDRVADFSGLNVPGSYLIKASDGTKSPVFVIGGDVYKELLNSVLRMLYLQRCGTELGSAHAGIYAHPACHTETALVYGTDRRIDVRGGWHDAGDYGRYVVSGAKAAADLLLSYEMAPALLDDAGIPESGDGTDDRLQEARYELDWLLKMQAEDGGVYHKVTGRNFPGFIKPQEETEEAVVSPVSVTASADFAGVLAMAARVFTENGSPDLASAAEGYTAAAERAWAYLEEHRDAPGFTNPPDIVTGEYPDEKSGDERFWAAAELARLTGKAGYREAAAELLASGAVTAELGWVEMGGYGLFTLLTDPALPAEDEARVTAEALLRGAADKISAGIAGNPYGIDRADSFEWGSNMGIANDGVILLMAASVFGEDGARAGAARQLDYLLGENAAGYCFVTGTGTLSPEHPHHRPSTAFGAPMPGMLVGGPDNALEDPYARSALAGCSPAKCYADSDQSFSTNETAVYWNSPLVTLLCGLTSANEE